MKKPLLIAIILLAFAAAIILTPQPVNKVENSQISVASDPEALLRDEDMIMKALVEKNGWDISGLEVTISSNDGTYATGAVGTVEPGPGGGIWFAKKVESNWEIVWDGNGSVMCSDLEGSEDFPADLIPRCFDENFEVVVR